MRHRCISRSASAGLHLLFAFALTAISLGPRQTLAVPPLPGDLNADGLVNGQDITGFVSAVLDGSSDPCLPNVTDVNFDGTFDDLDIDLFVQFLLGNVDPAEYAVPQQQFLLGPIAALTTDWHPAPPNTPVPLGTTLQFEVTGVAPSVSVDWTGAVEVERGATYSRAEYVASNLGPHAVEVVVDAGSPCEWESSSQLNVVDVANITCIVDVSVSPLLVDESSSNATTMQYYFSPDSIAQLTEIAPGYYQTSVGRRITMAAQTTPPGFEPLMEWRRDGVVLGLGATLLDHVIDFPGNYTFAVGPVAQPEEIQIDTYAVTISSHISGEDIVPEGQPVTFTAVTDPPGYEADITWLSSTKYGTASPVLGSGPTFTIQFDDTWGPWIGNPEVLFQWFGVKADHATFFQDEGQPNGEIEIEEIVDAQPRSTTRNFKVTTTWTHVGGIDTITIKKNGVAIGMKMCGCAQTCTFMIASVALDENDIITSEVLGCDGVTDDVSTRPIRNNAAPMEWLDFLCVDDTEKLKCGEPMVGPMWTVLAGTAKVDPDSQAGLLFPVEGVEASDNVKDVKIRYKAKDGDGDEGRSIWNLTVLKVDLDIDSDNDGAIEEADDPIEENAPGKFICVNNDDDNNDGTPDKDEAGSTTGEDDLVRIDMETSIEPTDGKWKLTFPGKVKIWEFSDRSNGAFPAIVSGQLRDFPMPSICWGEGLMPSAASGDVEIILAVTKADGTELCSDKVKVTVFKLDLDTDLDIDEDIDDDDDPLEEKRGAYIAVNNDDDDRDSSVDTADGQVVANGGVAGSVDENNLKEFRMSNVLPADLQNKGKVILARNNGKVRVFSDAKKGTAAANDKAVLFSATAAAYAAGTEGNGKKTWDLSNATQRAEFQALVAGGLWVEGLEAGATERDAELTLSYMPQGGTITITCEKIKITVVRFERLRATIDATAEQTTRNPSNAPNDHTFDNVDGGIVYYLDENTTDRDRNFDVPHALPLIRNADDQVALEVTRQPAINLRWQVNRSADDAGALGTGTPTLSSATGTTTNLASDERGSFLVSCYVDANENDTFDDGEPRTILPYLLIDATLNNDATATMSGNITVTRVGTAVTWATTGGQSVRSGAIPFNINMPNTAGIYLASTVDFVGGGANGRRGLDRAFGGWCNNNPIALNFNGSYQGGHTTAVVFASNVPAGSVFLPGGAAPTLVAPPLLDSGRPAPGTGGDTATLSTSRHGTTTNLALGRRILVEAVDSPGLGFSGDHPGFAGNRLTRAQFDVNFDAWLILWTNANAMSGATAHAANRTYGALHEYGWTIRATWTFNAAGTAAVVVAPAIAQGATTTHNPLVKAEDRAVEVRPPTGLSLLGIDARN